MLFRYDKALDSIESWYPRTDEKHGVVARDFANRIVRTLILVYLASLHANAQRI